MGSAIRHTARVSRRGRQRPGVARCRGGALVPERRMGAAAGAGRRDPVLLGDRAELLHARQLLRDDAVQRRARPARGRADAGHRRGRHRSVGRIDDGARRGHVRRRRITCCICRCRWPPPCAMLVGLRRRRAECAAHREAAAAGVDRDARDVLAVSRRRRGDDAGRGQLHRVSRRVPVPRPGLSRRRDPGAAAAVRADRGGLRGAAAPFGDRPRVVRDRVHRAGRALRRDSGGQARRPGLRAVGADRERRGDHLRGASGTGPIGRGHRLRARCDHRRRARRHVGVRRPRHDRGHAARALRARGPADRAAPGRVAVRADRCPDRRAAARPRLPSIVTAARRAAARARGGGGVRGEEQSGCGPVRDDPRRLADRGRHQRRGCCGSVGAGAASGRRPAAGPGAAPHW